MSKAFVFNFSGHRLDRPALDKLLESHTTLEVFNEAPHFNLDGESASEFLIQTESLLDSFLLRANESGVKPVDVDVSPWYYVPSGHAGGTLIIYQALSKLIGTCGQLILRNYEGGLTANRKTYYPIKQVVDLKKWGSRWRSIKRADLILKNETISRVVPNRSESKGA